MVQAARASWAKPATTVTKMARGRMPSVRWLGATALLGCGASALSPSRVAFGQHGVAEGDENVMHAPVQGGSSRLASMTPQLLSSAIARVMSLDARAEVGAELPAGDIFSRPDGNVLVFVDGLRPKGKRGRGGGRCLPSASFLGAVMARVCYRGFCIVPLYGLFVQCTRPAYVLFSCLDYSGLLTLFCVLPARRAFCRTKRTALSYTPVWNTTQRRQARH